MELNIFYFLLTIAVEDFGWCLAAPARVKPKGSR